MSDELITITPQDVREANQLSLACPICANPVERSSEHEQLRPVTCTRCGTLYHRVCWDQNGGKCAILGCGHTECRPFGTQGPVIKISAEDIPSEAEVEQYERRRIKQVERARQTQRKPQRPTKPRGFWQRLFDAIRRAFD